MVIIFDEEELALIKNVAKDYGYTEEKLKKLYNTIVSCNFQDDLYGIAGEHQTSYANNE